jgi:hypothetical protein
MNKPNLRIIKGDSRKPKAKGKPRVKANVVRVLQPGGTQKTSVRIGGGEEE